MSQFEFRASKLLRAFWSRSLNQNKYIEGKQIRLDGLDVSPSATQLRQYGQVKTGSRRAPSLEVSGLSDALKPAQLSPDSGTYSGHMF